MVSERITPGQFHDAEGVGDWRVLSDGACAYFHTGSLAAGARFLAAITEIDGLDDHHPQVDVRHGAVTVRLLTRTDDYWGMSEQDVALARQISTIARGQGIAADPGAVQTFLVIPGVPLAADAMPFWRAVLGYEPRSDSPDEDLVDPRDSGRASGSRRWGSRAETEGARSTLPCGSRSSRPRVASPRRWRPAGASSATRTRRRGGRWPTRRATRSTSRRLRAATEGHGGRWAEGRRPDAQPATASVSVQGAPGRSGVSSRTGQRSARTLARV